MDAEQRMRHVAAADKCLVEAFELLVKANDLLFDAGWARSDVGPKLFTTDAINCAITDVRHARHLIVGANWATPGSKES